MVFEDKNRLFPFLFSHIDAGGGFDQSILPDQFRNNLPGLLFILKAVNHFIYRRRFHTG